MITAIAGFFGMIIRIIYELVNNDYLISILIFTLITKIVLFPLSLGQIKSTEKLKKITPKDKEIREKYKNDKQKQSEELTKLYSENKINPLGGCLPLLIQIPIVLAMFYIVKQPLTYIIQTPPEQIKTYTQQVLNKENVTASEITQNELLVAQKMNLIDMQIFPGFNLGDVPSNVFNKEESKRVNPIVLIIPIITVVLSFVQIKLLKSSTSMSDEQAEMQKTMNLTMPILSGVIAFTMPLALGVYWLFGNVIQIGQQLIIQKIIEHDEKKLALDKGGKI